MRTWVPVVWERLMPCSINNNSSKWLQNSFALLPYPIHYRDKKQKQKLYGKVCICWKNVGEVTSCWNFPANFAVYITFQSNILPKATFSPTFWRTIFFHLVFVVFTLICCRTFVVVKWIFRWLITGFSLRFCNRIFHRWALRVVVSLHVVCTNVHVFSALKLNIFRYMYFDD